MLPRSIRISVWYNIPKNTGCYCTFVNLLLLLMIHHEEMRLYANRNRNPNPRKARKYNNAEYCWQVVCNRNYKLLIKYWFYVPDSVLLV